MGGQGQVHACPWGDEERLLAHALHRSQLLGQASPGCTASTRTSCGSQRVGMQCESYRILRAVHTEPPSCT